MHGFGCCYDRPDDHYIHRGVSYTRSYVSSDIPRKQVQHTSKKSVVVKYGLMVPIGNFDRICHYACICV
jgi:hypothetical protein